MLYRIINKLSRNSNENLYKVTFVLLKHFFNFIQNQWFQNLTASLCLGNSNQTHKFYKKKSYAKFIVLTKF